MGEPKLKPQLKLLALNYAGKCAGNAVASAIAAGYKPTYAKAQAYKLLARTDVKQYLAWLRENQEGKKELAIMEIGDIQAFWSKVIQNPAEETKNRLRASELLAKTKGAFTDTW